MNTQHHRTTAFVGLFAFGALAVSLSGCCNCEEAGSAFKVLGGGLELYKQAQEAPGTADMKSKTGCDMAMVLTPAMFEKLKSTIEEAGGEVNGDLPDDVKVTTVICRVNAGKKTPTCDEVAEAYYGGAGAKERFVVNVSKDTKKKGEDGAVCTASYDENGTRSAEVGEGGDGVGDKTKKSPKKMKIDVKKMKKIP